MLQRSYLYSLEQWVTLARRRHCAPVLHCPEHSHPAPVLPALPGLPSPWTQGGDITEIINKARQATALKAPPAACPKAARGDFCKQGQTSLLTSVMGLFLCYQQLLLPVQANLSLVAFFLANKPGVLVLVPLRKLHLERCGAHPAVLTLLSAHALLLGQPCAQGRG